MTALTEILAPTAIASGTVVVFATNNPYLIYGFILIVGITCIIWSISIIRGCKKREKRLARITANQAARRANAATDTRPT